MTNGRVYLVGAGPGDPGLLTVRAVECLRLADFVLYDYLVSPRALDHLRDDAQALCVDQLPGEHPRRWPLIHERMIAEARAGKIVVRLKGGDPFVFGRGGEEAEALREAGIPYEIVPGVSAAFAAAAYADIPLTHRAHASAVALVTGHEHPGKEGSKLDWTALSAFPGTLAVYMAVGRLGVIADELVARGRPADTPAALVHRASAGDQRTVSATLATIEAAAREASLGSPALLLVGPVVSLKPPRSWFEAKPLQGLRVLITRPREQARSFARQLELLGAYPEVHPVIAVRPPLEWDDFDRLIVSRPDWLVFTSANGVRACLDRLRDLGRDARTLGFTHLAAIGPATAAALAERHLVADVVAGGDLRSEDLAAALLDRVRGTRVLLAQAAEARPALRDALAAVANVDAVAVYRQEVIVDPGDAVFDRLRRGEIHAVTLTSPNIAEAFLGACGEVVRQRFRAGTTALVVNSGRVAELLKKAGFSSVRSDDPTDAAMARVLEHLRHLTS